VSIPKYSHIEHERRFLVTDAQPSLFVGSHSSIHDCYIHGTRIRLRCITPSDGGAPVFKMCKKYGHVTDTAEPIVNIYLSDAEYRVLADLPGAVIAKRRYHHDVAGVRFAVDAFDGPLSGLILAEVEAGDAATLAALVPPPWATREVTGDPWFRGGHLATVTAEMLHLQLQTISES
jgi:CYTH domain-containing protein